MKNVQNNITTKKSMINMELSYRLQSLFLLSLLTCSLVSHFIMAQKNSTLIFSKDNSIQNCSCSSNVQDCDYNLANHTCSCKTILIAQTDDATYRFSDSTDLTVWFANTSVLGMLLNFTCVQNLKLSFCATNSVPADYLILFGLKKLQLYSAAQVEFTEQNVTIHNDKTKCKSSRNNESLPLLHISFLDMSLLNGYSSLKAYSVGNVTNVTEYFPHLKQVDAFLPVTSSGYTVTVIY
ncbi:uncharacterized protein C21orf62 homolog [Protopterus annectens]|uniref:uncharacterized protein C21orf62 homolog n=1 Tax=Protopterus annectens TaxID=7888 RepID=UPI001CFBDA27|nr:uncharacterized protein C21orf62 homolog [Protopterus annectens]XP_043927352.1 uncharacterized protein C21orf62 homolog [Protopterus annectens]XP_043927353.1 uncharacterized protein C21orf62 homolog [Protopterus annectens]XP_043927354.1 uncharacterized protein C21orf62 homolog [Protopterus annectens]XP_043927355.1 uncharacterized protein C21orf62 homolog [Protopterus annectens]XP_043927356.1 uncharacterized protein C21orf62 homolog [Protopterus annectens]XP_043927357.1 uncharacterized prot